MIIMLFWLIFIEHFLDPKFFVDCTVIIFMLNLHKNPVGQKLLYTIFR